MRWFPVAFLANGACIGTRGGLELTIGEKSSVDAGNGFALQLNGIENQKKRTKYKSAKNSH